MCRKSSIYFVEQIALEVSGIAAVRKEVLVLEEAHTVAGTLDALGSELRVGLGERLAATGGETVSGRVKKRRVSLCSVRRSWQCEPGEVGRGVGCAARRQSVGVHAPCGVVEVAVDLIEDLPLAVDLLVVPAVRRVEVDGQVEVHGLLPMLGEGGRALGVDGAGGEAAGGQRYRASWASGR